MFRQNQLHDCTNLGSITVVAKCHGNHLIDQTHNRNHKYLHTCNNIIINMPLVTSGIVERSTFKFFVNRSHYVYWEGRDGLAWGGS